MSEQETVVEETTEDVAAEQPETGGDDNILSGVGAEAETPEDEVVDTAENPEAEARPEWLPEKFKSPEDLVKAYNELGGKLREKNDPPEQYEIEFPEGGDGETGLTEQDAEAFRDMGLSNDQAQQLVNYFYENVVPELQQARADVEKVRLAQSWNVDAESQEFSQRLTSIKSWAMRNMPEQAVAEMARTHNGVNALYMMMQAKADRNMAQGGNATRPTQADLSKMMQDERYVNRDPDFMEHVRKQYQLAYDA